MPLPHPYRLPVGVTNGNRPDSSAAVATDIGCSGLPQVTVFAKSVA